MRPDPWKLAALVLLVFLVDELARPEVAHAPGLVLDAAEVALPSGAAESPSEREGTLPEGALRTPEDETSTDEE